MTFSHHETFRQFDHEISAMKVMLTCGDEVRIHRRTGCGSCPCANAQRAVDLILGSTFEEENETTENAGEAAVSDIPAAIAVNIAPANYGHAHL